MWLKFLLAVLIVAFCTFLGYFAAGKYRARKSFYEQFSAFNDAYLAELKFERRPLGVFLRSAVYKGDFGKTISDLAEKRAITVGYRYLTPSERTDAETYLAMLGRGDSRSQSGYFSSCSPTLSDKKAKADKEAKERGTLYLKLGLLAGLAFVILIV